MAINHQAPLVARKEVFIQAPPDAVWKIHTDINAWNQWHPDITMANLEGPLAVGSVFRWKSGGMTLTSTVQVVESGRQISWTGRGLGSKAVHLWALEPRNGGTLVVTEESLEGWLVKLLKVVMPGFLEESLDAWLQAIKSQAEAGTHG